MKRRRQAGVALLLALSVTAIAATLAATLVYRSQLEVQRTTQVTRQSEAWHLVSGLEEWAFAVLDRDNELTPLWDGPADSWAQPLPPTPFPGGEVSGQLSDLSGRLNLNDLLDRETGQDRQVVIDRFRRLVVEVLSLDPAIVDQVLDYMDADGSPRPLGREVIGTRQTWRPVIHISELRALPALDGAAFDALEPHVATLAAGSPINVNMADEPVLMSLAPGITEGMARQLQRPAGSPWQNIAQFSAQPALESVRVDPDGLAVYSAAFRAEARILLDGQQLLFESTLVRTLGGGGTANSSRYHVRNRRLVGY